MVPWMGRTDHKSMRYMITRWKSLCTRPREPPGERSTGRPSSPPPRGCPATPTEHARRQGVRRRQRRGQGREPRAAPQRGSREATAPHPPTGLQAAGALASTPPRREGGSPLPPPERAAGAQPAPPAPAAGSDRNRGEQVSPRQRARTPHRSRPEKAGEHEPER